MTLSLSDMALYAGALFILFLTPGPVWLGIVARALSGGFRSAWPLAIGVVVGDMIWPFIAILGVSWIVSLYADFLILMRWVAVIMFVAMGVLLIKNADHSIASDNRLTRPGMWAGFLVGLALIMSNPKAILFYMGVLPGFFDLTRVTRWDIAVIVFLSFLVPLVGNLSLALMVDRVKRLITSPEALLRTNIISGVLLILVGIAIAFT